MKFEDIKIGSETLDILNQSFNDAPAAEETVAEPAVEAAEEEFEIPTRKETPVKEDAPVVTEEDIFEAAKSTKRASKGLEDLFDEEELKNKKKETKKKKKKLFFRDEDDDDDDDFFDDDDE